MKRVVLSLAVCLVLVTAFGCEKNEPVEAEPPAGAPEPAAGPQNPPGDLLHALMRLGRGAKQVPADFAALSQAYDGVLSDYVRGVDADYGTGLDPQIRTALQKGDGGVAPVANSEKAGKLAQRAFLTVVQKSLAAAQDGTLDEAGMKRLAEAAPVAGSVLGRRSRWLGRGAEFPETFEAGLDRLRTALDAGDAAGVSAAAVEMDTLLTKGIVLSILYELSELEKVRGDGTQEASRKRVEAEQYHLSVVDEQTQRNEKGAAVVSTQLGGPAERIDVDLVRGILAGDFKDELAGVDRKFLGS